MGLGAKGKGVEIIIAQLAGDASRHPGLLYRQLHTVISGVGVLVKIRRLVVVAQVGANIRHAIGVDIIRCLPGNCGDRRVEGRAGNSPA